MNGKDTTVETLLERIRRLEMRIAALERSLCDYSDCRLIGDLAARGVK